MMSCQDSLSSESQKQVMDKLGRERLIHIMREMLSIRNLETRAESCYQQGKIGGFFHAYTGQEAVQTAALEALGKDHWWITSYRCHALAYLLGASFEEIMAEFFGRSGGNALGRGGSMHLFTDKLLGGFGIVGGQVPIAVGAAFSAKYKGETGKVAVCFLGDGAVAQGAFHEAVNLASLWDLPCIFVIENNQWGMGTAVHRAVAVERLAEDKAPGYNMKGYTVDGMDFFTCYKAFQEIYQELIQTNRPCLVEVLTERFRGHSISDPGLYRSKAELVEAMERDPLRLMKEALVSAGILSEEEYKAMDKEERVKVQEAIKRAEESPWPDPNTLEEDVFAP